MNASTTGANKLLLTICLQKEKNKISKCSFGRDHVRKLPIIGVVFQRHNFAQKSQCAEHQKCVGALHQHQYSSQQVLVQYTVLDVVRVVFHTKRQQLQHQAEQLHGVIVFVGRCIIDCVGQKWC